MAGFESYRPPQLRTSRLDLEPLVEAHADFLHAPLSDPGLYTFTPLDPPSLEAVRDRCRMLESRRSPDGSELWLTWAARLRDGTHVGLFEATVRADATAYVAYFVFRTFQRQGLAAEGVEAVLAHLKTDVGVREARALIDTRNEASWRLVERLGFRRARLIEYADHFKGAPSDEFEYTRQL